MLCMQGLFSACDLQLHKPSDEVMFCWHLLRADCQISESNSALNQLPVVHCSSIWGSSWLEWCWSRVASHTIRQVIIPWQSGQTLTFTHLVTITHMHPLMSYTCYYLHLTPIRDSTGGKKCKHHERLCQARTSGEIACDLLSCICASSSGNWCIRIWFHRRQ